MKTPVFLLYLLACFQSGVASAQVVVVPGERVPVQAPGAGEVPAGAVHGPKGNPPGSPDKPGEKGENAADKDKKGEAKDAAMPAVTQRPSEPLTPPDPKELLVRPNADGLVEFAFRNQPWPQLLEWLSEISGEPLDWIALPGDFVNLASPRAYTIEQTQDLFNRHLLARGFTLLRLSGGLSVVKTENLNPAMVPSVTVEQLASLPDYQFVRTVMELEWLPAEKLAEEMKPLISAAGKLVPLTATNRIEAMDAVVNLRRISQILADEQSVDAQGKLAREFPLRFISAAQAKKLLEEFLGVSQSKSPMDPRQMQQMMQMMQQMGGGGQQNGEKPKAENKDPEISIVASERNNSLIVNAPANRMAVAAEFIKRVDVPGADLGSLEDVRTRLETFRLSSITPAKVAEMLQQMNVLEPSTRITVDDANLSLVVFGSPADRYMVGQLVKRLDGSGREFSVLQLRRLDPREVAESITFLMGVDENKKSENSSRSRFSYWGDQPKEDNKAKDHFRVAANVRNRQILVWANDFELTEVKNLLVKLGELPPESGSGSRLRTIEATNSPATYEYLQRLQRYWQSVSPTPLELPPEESFKQAEEVEIQEDKTTVRPRKDERLKPKSATEELRTQLRGPEPSLALVSTQSSASLDDAENTNKTDRANNPPGTDFEPPVRTGEEFDRLFGAKPRPATTATAPGLKGSIRIELDEQGNLILMAEDPRLLDQLESMMLQTPPPRKPYIVFYVKHASASWVVLNLKDYFAKAKEEKDSTADNFYRYFWGGEQEKKEDPKGLAGGGELKFVYDNDTGSIVVTGSDDAQLRVIEDLIKLWDVEESSQKSSRFTQLVEVKYSKAQTIAETVKEAYRDLLSSNDKTFVGGAGGGDGGRGGDGQQKNQKDRGGSGMVDNKSGQDSGDTSFTFKGKLSIGVDSVGNTLLVSAEGEALLKLVTEMIQQLDEAAIPSGSVEVLEIHGGKSYESAVRAFLGKSDDSKEEKKPEQREPSKEKPKVNSKE